MKVGIISERLNSELTGVGNYLYNLVKKSIEINSIAYLINYKKTAYFPKVSNIIISYPLMEFKVARLLWYLLLPFNVNKYSDLDIIHNPFQHPTFFKFSHKKYIITVHDLIIILFPEYVRKDVYLVQKLLLPRTLKTADKIIADSKCTKSDLIKYFDIPAEKIDVIYLAADEIYRPLDIEKVNAIKIKYGIDYPFILYLGTLERRKNIPHLINSFHDLQKKGLNYKLVLIGKKGWKCEEIFSTIDRLHLQDDIKFIGYVPTEDLPCLYNAADLFVFPSLYEGFGLPPLEAMACGTPVITSNTSSLPEVVGDAGIIVDPYNVEELSEAMYNVLNDSSLRDNLITKGLDRAKEFSWEKYVKELSNIYMKLS